MDQDDAGRVSSLRGANLPGPPSQPKKAESGPSTSRLQGSSPGHAEAKQLMATEENPGNGEVTPASTGVNIPSPGHAGFLGVPLGA